MSRNALRRLHGKHRSAFGSISDHFRRDVEYACDPEFLGLWSLSIVFATAKPFDTPRLMRDLVSLAQALEEAKDLHIHSVQFLLLDHIKSHSCERFEQVNAALRVSDPEERTRCGRPFQTLVFLAVDML
ncbi:hypothetical protein BB934_39680 (plasmid) [Microvirga ossetica]|uniref:Uncharacterized protein n=1 Tax=Microvirga ossetica TaxID=1882682 RepID=A0A1B2EWJ6_9HYPH|nr:hypothetical protein BB934_39680 [Microvirga ossetica]